jgi:hypothetical protein
MCYYITATVPEDADLERLRPVIDTWKRGFARVTNPHVQPQLPPGDQYFCLTRGMCDCGTVLGSLSAGEGDPAAADARELEKLRRKGWSESKIARWFSERQQTQEKRARERAEARGQRNHHAVDWIDFLRALLATGITPRVGILLHWYRASPENEGCVIRQKQRVKMDEVTPDLVMQLEEDVLYEFSQ